MLKRLSNRSEQRLFEEIVGAANAYRAHIYRKVRIADVVDISGLRDHHMGRFALQAHFDFCIGDEDHNPKFAIEFDGLGHDNRNDELKDEIARSADLALFRVDEQLLNRSRGGMTFLQYLVHTYFLGDSFKEMQLSGDLDPSEPFMMSGFLKPDAKHIFDSEFDFSGPARRRLNGIFHKAGLEGGPFYHQQISGAMFGRWDSSFMGFASVPVKGRFVYGRGRLVVGTPSLGLLGELPFGWSALGDYCDGMVLEDLCDAVEVELADGGHALRSRPDVEQEIESILGQGFAPMRSFGGPDQWLLGQAFPRR